jgi:hypothetical protein
MFRVNGVNRIQSATDCGGVRCSSVCINFLVLKPSFSLSSFFPLNSPLKCLMVIVCAFRRFALGSQSTWAHHSDLKKCQTGPFSTSSCKRSPWRFPPNSNRHRPLAHLTPQTLSPSDIFVRYNRVLTLAEIQEISLTHTVSASPLTLSCAAACRGVSLCSIIVYCDAHLSLLNPFRCQFSSAIPSRHV